MEKKIQTNFFLIKVIETYIFFGEKSETYEISGSGKFSIKNKNDLKISTAFQNNNNKISV